jgi:hypothetical protein
MYADCFNSAQAQEKASSITTHYSFAADAFYCMDQVSEAIPKWFLMPDYLHYWHEQYGITEIDREYLQQYTAIRKKYITIHDEHPDITIQTIAEASEGLFASAPDFIDDPIACAFFSSDTIHEACTKLIPILTQEEQLFICNFYAHFNSNLEKTLDSYTSEIMQTHVQKQNEFLNTQTIRDHLENIRNFYNSTPYQYQAHIVWRPTGRGFCATIYDSHIIIQLSPDMLPMSQKLFMIYSGVCIHEATHGFSARAPQEQKKALTQAFITVTGELVDIQTAAPYGLSTFIEEPLVQILSQALLYKKQYPQYFDLDCGAYSHPLVRCYLPYIEEYFCSNKSIDTNLMQKLAQAYIAFINQQNTK